MHICKKFPLFLNQCYWIYGRPCLRYAMYSIQVEQLWHKSVPVQKFYEYCITAWFCSSIQQRYWTHLSVPNFHENICFFVHTWHQRLMLLQLTSGWITEDRHHCNKPVIWVPRVYVSDVGWGSLQVGSPSTWTVFSLGKCTHDKECPLIAL